MFDSERLRFPAVRPSASPARTSSPQTAKVSGVQVYSIDSRAKAASEGLQVGDVITAVDGTPTPDMDKVNELKQDKKAGDKLTLSVYRISTGKTLNITITLTDSHDLGAMTRMPRPSRARAARTIIRSRMTATAAMDSPVRLVRSAGKY